MAKQARTAKNAQKGTPPLPPGGGFLFRIFPLWVLFLGWHSTVVKISFGNARGGVPFSHFSFVGALFGVALNSS